ncbi:MAG: leucine-rich repeat domain-containing protein [Clostridia bacterium]|nr:leucine-rich repeat domain-containing protein [Clostridia bacterium]
MKKKICLLLFVLLCVCLTGTALTGCVKQHSYTLVSTTESTCTVAGVEVYSCTDCGKQKTTPLPLAPHAEVRHEGKAPTCIAEGWAEYVTCSSCDYTTYEALPATGVHTWDEGEVTKVPTCEGFGERTYQCIHCENASMTERIAASGHSITSYEGKAPTCSEVGWVAYEACENCDYTTYEEIPATGEHKWDEGKITQNPTCVSVGERTYTCTVCFDATKAEEIPPTGIHTWSEGAVTKEPSCVSVGERTYTCTVCSKAKMTEEISATGHKTVTHNAKAPTCAKIGWAEYVTCSSCDYTTYEAIPATGEHKWDEGTVTKEPSCEVAGQRSYKCTTCSGAFRAEAISPTGHSYSTDWISNEEYHYHACACGDWVDEARHISSGSASLTEAEVCTVCGYIIHEKLAYDPNLILELSDSGYKLVGLHDKNVSEVIIPDIVTVIGNWAFDGCTALTRVVIPDSVTVIEARAFYACERLTEAVLGNSVAVIGSWAFFHCKLTDVAIPASVTTIGVGAFGGCTSLTSIAVDGANKNYQSIDGNLYTKDGKTLIQYAVGKKATSFVIPTGVGIPNLHPLKNNGVL